LKNVRRGRIAEYAQGSVSLRSSLCFGFGLLLQLSLPSSELA
jgi:hypothetical protein